MKKIENNLWEQLMFVDKFTQEQKVLGSWLFFYKGNKIRGYIIVFQSKLRL